MKKYLEQKVDAVCGREILLLNGTISKNEWVKVIGQMTTSKHAIALISITVGAVGLNLQNLNSLYILDRQWSPQVCFCCEVW